MEAGRNKGQYNKVRTSYIEGSTVRKLKAMPDSTGEEQYYEVPSPRRRVHRQTKSLSGINLASLLVLSVAIIATLYVCVEYLKLQYDVTHMDKQITARQQELVTLTKDNDAAYEKINKAIDLDEIYRYAVEELGMVYPNKNTVIKYHSSDADYTIQYQEIPD